MSVDQPLADAGLSLLGVLQLPVSGLVLPATARGYDQLLVFGNAGSLLWSLLPDAVDEADPIDTYSIAAVEAFLKRESVSEFVRLYPGTTEFIDLRAVGIALGWHHDSPLGIGIHETYGTWFAYRVAVAARADFPVTTPPPTTSPCTNCSDRPCVTTCPVGAVGEPFDLTACVHERLREGSACAENCPARWSCPAGKGFRYEPDQIRYHYQHSLAAIRRFSA